MKFYKIQKDKEYWDNNGRFIDFVVEDELITESERKHRKLPLSDNFKPVEIKRTDTHWFFGCRFENLS